MVTAKKKKKRRATYKDVLAAPEHMVAEIVDGELYLSPRPRTSHAVSITSLSGRLFSRFSDGPGGSWFFMIEPELHFGRQIVIPDIAGWRRERLPVIKDVPFMTLPPDWLCEGLSTSTVKLDRVKKMKVYAKAGVGNVWLLDPRIRTLEVYRLDDDVYTLLELFAAGELVRAEPFEDFELSMSDLWRGLPTTAREPMGVYAY